MKSMNTPSSPPEDLRSGARRRTAAILMSGALLLLGAAASDAPAGDGDRLTFTATQADVAVDGEFRSFTADIDFDPAHPADGKVTLTIELASVSTGSRDADELLRGRDFFDVAHFPQASFSSTAISTDGPERFQAQGQFSLKGRSSRLAIPFAAHPAGSELRIEGSVQLSRLAYRVGEGEWADTGTLADRVLIRFALHLPRDSHRVRGRGI